MPHEYPDRSVDEGPALVVSQSGRVTPGLEAFVAAAGTPVETVVTDRPESGRHYLSPATVERIETQYAGATLVVVDGELHPGQAVDLGRRLPSVTVRDRRSAVWERLAESNPVAATRFELRQCRLACRVQATDERDAAGTGPDAASGRLAERRRQRDERREQLATRRAAARQRVLDAHEGVDGHVVLLCRPGSGAATLHERLTGTAAPEAVGRPARASTDTTTIGPHTVAVTHGPGVPGTAGIPEWFETVVPGVIGALSRADLVVGVGPGAGSLSAAAGSRFEADAVAVGPDADERVRATVADTLGTATLVLRLPYADPAHALVSELHDERTVHELEYGEKIRIRVDVSASAVDPLARRVTELGGEVTRPDG